MTIFPRELIRLPNLIAGNFARWSRRNAGGDLHDLSDKALKDIGMAEPLRRDLDAVKPFWMP
ncbi:MAG TPA: hypothetical protein VHY10_06340 [Xanthobacteraceae bacterium]|jgi:uncharacterized protein YjiS (DUF1127 family)|nr:hypothetical protein [Xanthobacteraceae bacterium]